MFGDDASITEVQDGADLRVETLGEVFDFEVKGTPKKGTAARQSLLVNSPRSAERLRSGEVTLVRVSRLNTEEPRVTFLKREEYRIETRPYGTYVKLLVSTDF